MDFGMFRSPSRASLARLARVGWIALTVSTVSAGSATAQTYEVLHAFQSPAPTLIQAADGDLFGTTSGDGVLDHGTVFCLSTTGHVAVLHTFTGDDGDGPTALIQAADGDFYGGTVLGGTNGSGTVFRIGSDGAFETLHQFDGADGSAPSPLIQASDGKFYGVTAGGGAMGTGTIFRIDSSGAFESIGEFDPDLNGAVPNGPLVESAGLLCGTTQEGGSGPAVGTVFCSTLEGSITTDYSFDGDDGAQPEAGLLNRDGELFGTTLGGGAGGEGTIFKTAAGSFDLDTWHSFGGEEGAHPAGALAGPAEVHGTTGAGGAAGFGTIFRLNSDHSVDALHHFTGIGGSGPSPSLFHGADGFLYGTAGGGVHGAGIAFRITDAVVALHEVEPTSGPAEGGEAIDAIGGGFVQKAGVTIGGLAASPATLIDATLLSAVAPPLSPGTLNDVTVTVPDLGVGFAAATLPDAFFADFVDLPQEDPFHDFVETIFRKGITAGCGSGSYCPQDAVTRAQMAVFLLKSEHGASFAPPPCTGVFADVACPSTFADWIEQLAAEGITAGCGAGDYCPDAPVTRAQMSVFLLKTKHGSAYAPPACTGAFGDVACPSLFADWIEQLAAEQITGGCGGGNFCPDNPNTRAQMSAFLVKTFDM